MKHFGLLCLFLSTWLASAEIKLIAPPHPKILQPVAEKTLTELARGFFGMALSDADGNVFVHPDPFQDPQVLKISAKSSTTLVFKVPNDAASSLAFYDFNVTPSGTVWILANPFANAELRAFKFDSGGSVKSSVELEVPAGVQIRNFLALENDFLLVAGFYTDNA